MPLLCHSGIRWNSVRLSACHGRAPTPNRAGPVCYLVCRSGWIGCLVSDVIQPSPWHPAAVRERVRERERESEGRTVRRLGNPLKLWTSFRHSYLLQVYLMLHVCLTVGWQEINLLMIHRTIRHQLHPYIHPSIYQAFWQFILLPFFITTSFTLSHSHIPVCLMVF